MAWVTVPPLKARTESVGDAIRSVIVGVSSEVQACWMAHGGADLEPVEREYGEVIFAFDVDGDGQVSGLEIAEDTTGSPELAECVRALLPPLRFRVLGRGAEVRVEPLRVRFLVRRPNL